MKVNKSTKPTKHFAENFVYDTISANKPKDESSNVTAVLGPGDADALKQHNDNVKAERDRKKKAYSEPAMKKISAEPDKKIKELQDTIKGKKTISIPAKDKSSIHKILKALEGLGYTHNGKTKGYTIRRSEDESLYREIYLTDLDESVDDPTEEQKDTAQYICFSGEGRSIYDMEQVCATFDDAKEYAKTHPEVNKIERSYTPDGLDTQNKVVWRRKTNEHLKDNRHPRSSKKESWVGQDTKLHLSTEKKDRLNKLVQNLDLSVVGVKDGSSLPNKNYYCYNVHFRDKNSDYEDWIYYEFTNGAKDWDANFVDDIYIDEETIYIRNKIIETRDGDLFAYYENIGWDYLVSNNYISDSGDEIRSLKLAEKLHKHLKDNRHPRSFEHLNTRRGKHSHKELIEHLHSKNRRIKESSHQYDLSDGVFSLSDSDFQELLDIVCDELPYWSGFEDEDGRELLDFFEIKRDNSYDDREPVALLLSYYVSGEPYDQHGYNGARELLGISDDDDEDRYDLIDCKSVPGEEGGPLSEYNLYYDAETDQYFTQLGDSDYYPADIENAEQVFDNLVDAQEWFDNHTGTEKTEESFDIHTYKPEIATRSLWEEIVKKNKVDDLQFFLESSFDNKPTANDLSRLLADKDYVRDILELDKDKKDIKASPTFEESLANEVADNKLREDYEKDANPLVEPLEDEFNCYDPSLN